MPYYGAGDYYGRGDYYRGDYYRAGGLFSFLGKIAKTVVGIIPGPVGTIGRALLAGRGAAPAVVPTALPLTPLPPPVFDGGGGPGQQPEMPGGGPFGGPMVRGFGPVRGHHLNRSTYVTRGGGTSRWGHDLEVHQKGEVLVTNRRMNAGNARALKHALRRVKRFAHLARQVMTFVHPRGAGKARFKFHRKKKAA